MRCGPPGPSFRVKLNLPAESVLVLAATSMPFARLMRMISSPAAGLLVVPLVTVPERDWAAAWARVSAKRAVSKADFASLVKRTPLLPRILYKSGGAKKSALHRLCDRQSKTTDIHQPA